MAGKADGGGRSGFVVVVPTTAGAIEIMGLRWSQKIPSSRVVLGNETADQCERWTKEYNSLLRPGDPMRALLGLHEAGGYRLVVSAEIDHGRSWMMPVSAGHFGAARGEPPHNDVARAKLMVWTTGAIDYSQPETARDATVVENDYHLVGKIDHSRKLFAAAAHAGTPVLCVLPRGPDAEKAATILGKVLASQSHHVAIASSLAELIAPIEGFLKAGDFQALPENAQPLAIYAPPSKEDLTATDYAPAPEPAAATAATPPPRTTGPRVEAPPLAGTHAAAPLYGDAGKRESRLPLGALIGVALLALVGGGAYLALGGAGREPAALPVVQNPPQQQPQQQTAIPPTQQIQPVQPSQPPAQPLQPQQAATNPAGATPVARLTLLTAPAGSSCQAQIYQLPPRFAETIVEVPGDKTTLEIDGANLCGVAVSGATFQRGTGSASVQSLSSATRVVFTQSGQAIAPPALAVTGGGRIEVRLK